MRLVVYLLIIFPSLSFAYCLKEDLKENTCRYSQGDHWCQEKYQQDKPYAYRRNCDYKISTKIEKAKKEKTVFEKGTLNLAEGFDPSSLIEHKYMPQDNLKRNKYINEVTTTLELDNDWDKTISYYDGFSSNVLDTLINPKSIDPNLELESAGICATGNPLNFFSKSVKAVREVFDPTCPYVKSPMISPSKKQANYCNDFAIDYFYYLNKENVELDYKGHKVKKKPWTIEGAMFALGWVPQESGWKLGYHHQFGNYWGIDGGRGVLYDFDTFENGLAFKLNHMEKGIQINGKTSKHPGWPDALNLLENKRNWTDDQMNKALRSGPYCDDGYPYNYNKPAGYSTCKNYAGSIRKTSETVLKACLSVFAQPDKYPSEKFQSVIYPDSNQANKEIRKEHVIKQMKKYAKKHYPEDFCSEKP